MKNNFYKSVSIALLLILGVFISGCSSTPPVPPVPPVPTPEVSITLGAVTDATISFTIVSKNAESCAYHYIVKPATGAMPTFTGEEIFEQGTTISAEPKVITLNDLIPETEYVIFAAAKTKGVDPVVAKNPTTATTESKKAGPELKVVLTSVSSTSDAITFMVAPINAESCAYYYFEKPVEGEIPTLTSDEIFEKGVTLATAEAELVTVSELTADTEYVITAAVRAEGSQPAVAQYITIKTETDEEEKALKVTISDVITTYDAITFTVTPKNAGASACDVYMKTEGMIMPDAYKVISFGRKIENLQGSTTFTFDNRRDNTTYIIFAAVESPASYDRVMESIEVTTKKRPDPEQTAIEKFTTGNLKVYKGRNYVISSENDKYAVKLDIIGALNPALKPSIEAHEYIYSHSYTIQDEWVMSYLSSITEKSSGKKLDIEKGTMNVAYTAPNYTITGKLITKSNVEFNFELTGQIPYPIDRIETGVWEIAETGQTMDLSGEFHNLHFKFSDKESIEKEHTVGTTILATSTLEAVGGASYGLQSGKVTISQPVAERFTIAGNIILNNGDIITLNLENVKMNVPDIPEPEPDVITFKTIRVQSAEDYGGWLSVFHITLKDDDWTAIFEIGDSGALDVMPTGKYNYASWSEGVSMNGVGDYKITNSKTKEEIRDLDSGTIVITKVGDVYTLVIDIKRDNGKNFDGIYTGSIIPEVSPY